MFYAQSINTVISGRIINNNNNDNNNDDDDDDDDNNNNNNRDLYNASYTRSMIHFINCI